MVLGGSCPGVGAATGSALARCTQRLPCCAAFSGARSARHSYRAFRSSPAQRSRRRQWCGAEPPYNEGSDVSDAEAAGKPPHIHTRTPASLPAEHACLHEFRLLPAICRSCMQRCHNKVDVPSPVMARLRPACDPGFFPERAPRPTAATVGIADGSPGVLDELAGAVKDATLAAVAKLRPDGEPDAGGGGGATTSSNEPGAASPVGANRDGNGARPSLADQARVFSWWWRLRAIASAVALRFQLRRRPHAAAGPDGHSQRGFGSV